jgi:hypothetical protein
MDKRLQSQYRNINGERSYCSYTVLAKDVDCALFRYSQNCEACSANVQTATTYLPLCWSTSVVRIGILGQPTRIMCQQDYRLFVQLDTIMFMIVKQLLVVVEVGGLEAQSIWVAQPMGLSM